MSYAEADSPPMIRGLRLLSGAGHGAGRFLPRSALALPASPPRAALAPQPTPAALPRSPRGQPPQPFGSPGESARESPALPPRYRQRSVAPLRASSRGDRRPSYSPAPTARSAHARQAIVSITSSRCISAWVSCPSSSRVRARNAACVRSQSAAICSTASGGTPQIRRRRSSASYSGPDIAHPH